MPEIFELSSSTSRKPLPMGVNYQIYYLAFMKSKVHSYCEADISIFIGCATSTPNECSPRFYVISGKTNYEMHHSMKNISMKVALGYALPSGPGQVWP
jgi:hypothetical protein